MEIQLGGILGITFVSTILPSVVLGVDTIIGRFQKFHKQPKLKECAASITQKNEYVGVRISQQEGACQALQRSWLANETMESDYAYAKKVFVQENFQPPLEIKYIESWTIPGVLKTGAKLDVFVSYQQPTGLQGSDIGLVDYLGEINPDRNGDSLILKFNNHNTQLYDRNRTVETSRSRWFGAWSQLSIKSGSKYMLKLSLLTQTDSVRILANGVELLTYQFNIQFDTMKKIFVRNLYAYSGAVFVDRYQFTETIN